IEMVEVAAREVRIRAVDERRVVVGIDDGDRLAAAVPGDRTECNLVEPVCVPDLSRIEIGRYRAALQGFQVQREAAAGRQSGNTGGRPRWAGPSGRRSASHLEFLPATGSSMGQKQITASAVSCQTLKSTVIRAATQLNVASAIGCSFARFIIITMSFVEVRN